MKMKILVSFFTTLIFANFSCAKNDLETGKANLSSFDAKHITISFGSGSGYKSINSMIIPISIKVDLAASLPGLFLRVHSLGFRFKGGIIIKEIHKNQLGVYFGKTRVKAGETLQGAIPMPYMRGAPMELVLTIEKYEKRTESRYVYIKEPDKKNSSTKSEIVIKKNREFITIIKSYDSNNFANLLSKKPNISSITKGKDQIDKENLFLKTVEEKMNGAWSSLTQAEKNRKRAILKYEILYKR